MKGGDSKKESRGEGEKKSLTEVKQNRAERYGVNVGESMPMT